jgi:hypothetical protein
MNEKKKILEFLFKRIERKTKLIDADFNHETRKIIMAHRDELRNIYDKIIKDEY